MKEPKILILIMLACVLFTCEVAGEGKEGEPAEQPDPAGLQFPITIERVWYRTDSGKGLAGIYKATGDLVIDEGSVEFVHRKKGWTIGMEQVHTISFGKMRGDVDTDWAVLLVRKEGTGSLIGIRDGRKMGFGRKTEWIYRVLRESARRQTAAQYAVPDGLVVFERMRNLMTLAIPAGWTVHHDDMVITESGVGEGKVTFSSPAAGSGPGISLSVERREARRGMRCRELSDQVVNGLRAEFGGADGDGQPVPADLDGCSGIRLKRDVGGTISETVAAVNGDYLFLISIDAGAGSYEEALKIFEAVLGTVRFNVAR